MISAGFKIIHDIKNDMRKESLRTQKAMSWAVSRTAFIARKDLVQALKMGRLGLTPTAPLRTGKKSRRKSRPLAGLFKGVQYRKTGYRTGGGGVKVTGKRISAEVGFLGGSAHMDWYRDIAEKHLTGYRLPLTDPDLRKKKAALGIHLKRDTTFSVVPARDPIGAFYRLNKDKLQRSIADIFGRKMRGERVES